MLTELVRQSIRQSGLTQMELARRSGVPQPRISTFLKGQDAYGQTLDKLIAALPKNTVIVERNDASSTVVGVAIPK